MKKILGKVGIIFTIILLALITFTNAQEDDGLNYIEAGNIIKLTEEQEQEIQRQKEQKFEENESQKLDEKETENIALEQNVGISTIANSADYKVTQLDLKEWNLEISFIF